MILSVNRSFFGLVKRTFFYTSCFPREILAKIQQTYIRGRKGKQHISTPIFSTRGGKRRRERKERKRKKAPPRAQGLRRKTTFPFQNEKPDKIKNHPSRKSRITAANRPLRPFCRTPLASLPFLPSLFLSFPPSPHPFSPLFHPKPPFMRFSSSLLIW